MVNEHDSHDVFQTCERFSPFTKIYTTHAQYFFPKFIYTDRGTFSSDVLTTLTGVELMFTIKMTNYHATMHAFIIIGYLRWPSNDRSGLLSCGLFRTTISASCCIVGSVLPLLHQRAGILWVLSYTSKLVYCGIYPTTTTPTGWYLVGSITSLHRKLVYCGIYHTTTTPTGWYLVGSITSSLHQQACILWVLSHHYYTKGLLSCALFHITMPAS